jgi:hypothetical protein
MLDTGRERCQALLLELPFGDPGLERRAENEARRRQATGICVEDRIFQESGDRKPPLMHEAEAADQWTLG